MIEPTTLGTHQLGQQLLTALAFRTFGISERELRCTFAVHIGLQEPPASNLNSIKQKLYGISWKPTLHFWGPYLCRNFIKTSSKPHQNLVATS